MNSNIKTKKADNYKNIVILGAGGFGREVIWLIKSINRVSPGSYNIVGFWENTSDRVGQYINGVPIIDPCELDKYLPELYAVAAIGDTKNRIRAIAEAEEKGCIFPSLIHPSVLFDPDSVEIGQGSIICAGTIITVDIKIHDHVVIGVDCTIGHDCEIKDFVTISPGCHLAGHTIVEKGAYLGAGAVTVEWKIIGLFSTIGAGGVVTRDIPNDVIAIGIPARVKS